MASHAHESSRALAMLNDPSCCATTVGRLKPLGHSIEDNPRRSLNEVSHSKQSLERHCELIVGQLLLSPLSKRKVVAYRRHTPLFRTGCSILSPAARPMKSKLHCSLVSLLGRTVGLSWCGSSTARRSERALELATPCVVHLLHLSCASTRHDPAHVAWPPREENIAHETSGLASLDAGHDFEQ